MKKTSSSQFVNQYKAVLYNPVGINASYHGGKGGFYKDQKAVQWMRDAVLHLHNQGFQPLPVIDELYWTDITLIVYTSRMDIDAPLKSVLDAIMKSLSIPVQSGKRITYEGLDDRFTGHLDVYKVWETPKDKQRVEIDISVYTVSTKEQFNERTKSRLGRD